MRVDSATLRSLDPFWVHDRNGVLLAAEVPDVACGVWHVETGELVREAGPLAWVRAGTEVVFLTGDWKDTLERRTRPQWKLRSRVHLETWAPGPERVGASPNDDLVGVLWWHQGEGGVELVELDDERGDRQLRGRGYMTEYSNLLGGPSFSPDGRTIAISEGRNYWWVADDIDDPEFDAEAPSRGGRFERGRVTFVEVATAEARHVPVFAEVAAGFEVPDERFEHVELLGRPEWVSASTVVLRPGFGPELRVGSPRSSTAS